MAAGQANNRFHTVTSRDYADFGVQSAARRTAGQARRQGAPYAAVLHDAKNSVDEIDVRNSRIPALNWQFGVDLRPTFFREFFHDGTLGCCLILDGRIAQTGANFQDGQALEDIPQNLTIVKEIIIGMSEGNDAAARNFRNGPRAEPETYWPDSIFFCPHWREATSRAGSAVHLNGFASFSLCSSVKSSIDILRSSRES